ncbi:hypothetical protein ACHHYP_00314 [Achlya hypogyna]|uniref:G protein gamma domain-containing protein n=1 Tax=Achlya hypogyna TaxID=1202772 RepID=A0A1V9ZUQ6_ACHHY|nr:hypothetical protein ACHHYP_00314 [Achlya hypogyna]
MADAQVKKLSDEIERLEGDLKALEAACTTSEAVKKIAEYCNTTPDPFLGDNETPNQWQANAQGGGGCVLQ